MLHRRILVYGAHHRRSTPVERTHVEQCAHWCSRFFANLKLGGM